MSDTTFTTQIQNKPLQGSVIDDALAGIVNEMFQDPDVQEHLSSMDEDIAASKQRMFSTFITRMSYDSVANRYSLHEGQSLSGFRGLATRALEAAEKKIGHPLAQEEKAEMFDFILGSLPSYTKGKTQTPHPTEPLDSTAIPLEAELYKVIAETVSTQIRATGGTVRFDEKIQSEIKQKMKDFFLAMNPPNKGMIIDQEMSRNILFSERAFDSIPIVMSSLLDTGKEQMGVDFTKPLTLEQLSRFNFLTDHYTWSPGDQDSKPNMTPGLLEEGIKRNRIAMLQHYSLKLADIIVKMEQDRDAKGLPKSVPATLDIHAPGNEQYHTQIAIDRMNSLVCHLMRQVGDQEYKEYLNRGIDRIQGVQQSSKTLLESLYAKRETQDDIYAAEKNGETIDLFYELANIRELKGVTYPLYMPHNTTPPSLSMLDVLLVQSANYGDRAMRVEIRQNKDMHRSVIASILEKLEEKKEWEPILAELTKKTTLPENFSSVQDLIIKEGDHAGELIESIRKPLIEVLLERLHNPKTQAALRKSIEAIAADAKKKMENIEEEKDRLEDDKKIGNVGDVDFEADMKRLEESLKMPRNLYNTLTSFKLAAEHPEAIPHYLIAECENSTDMLDAFFMLRAMGPEKVHGKGCEIISLLEHRTPVLNMSNLIREAYSNKYFAEYHNGLTPATDPAINRFDPTHPTVENPSTPTNLPWAGSTPLTSGPIFYPFAPLTVAQAKLERGIELKEGDDKRIVKAKKIIMGAGSDLLKSASPAGAALLQKTFEKTYGDMLDMDPPVLLIDYTGSGGGAHRSQPVTALIETIQGRSLRAARSSHANKAEQVLSARVSQHMGVFGNELDKEDKKIMMRLNMGNIAGLPIEDDHVWMALEPRLMKWSNAYQDWYKSPEIRLLLEDSAANYSGITSYADRPQQRVAAEKKKLDPKEMRAIGFGASFNHAGSCATMYMGASEFFYTNASQKELDAEGLKNVLSLYQASPKAQDAINRVTLGIANADMNTAWEFLGATREYKEGKVTVTVSGEGSVTSYTLDELLTKSNVPANLRAMAMVENEYQRVSRALIQIHRDLNGKVLADKEKDANTEPSELLLRELPSVLQDQIRKTREAVDPQRKELAKIHQKYKQQYGDEWVKHLPKRGDLNNPDYKRIYYAMATCYEHFEHIPASMLRVDWALEAEKQTQTQRAA